MTILNSIWRELQNEPQLDYATAMNFSRIHHFFVTETRNRNPNNRGIHNRNRNFKNRARILNSAFKQASKFSNKIIFCFTKPWQNPFDVYEIGKSKWHRFNNFDSTDTIFQMKYQKFDIFHQILENPHFKMKTLKFGCII